MLTIWGRATSLNVQAVMWAVAEFGHLLYRYMTLDFVKGPTPAVDRWYARLTARSAYAEHVMVSYERLRPT